MDLPHRFSVARLWRDYGLRLMRYGGVTIVGTVVGLTTYAIGLFVFRWPPLLANFVSVLASTPPAYLLNRHWVWGKLPGDHSVSREIGPFWAMTFLGFIVSTIAVAIADGFTDNRFIFLFTQIAAFGSLWLVKFAFLEKVLWKDGSAKVPITEPV